MVKKHRRDLLKYIVVGTGAAAVTLYGLHQFITTDLFVITQTKIHIPQLPKSFKGFKIALLTDIHHGPHNNIEFVSSIVNKTNKLDADIIALGGDYIATKPKYIKPCIKELSRLTAKEGVFAVLGNHDHKWGLDRVSNEFKKTNIILLKNSGAWITRDQSRIRFCGVDDYWYGRQDLGSALGDCQKDETAILLSHNPDYAEIIQDKRIKLVLCGHTHGGQIKIPFLGALIIPSMYGKKYAEGLIKAPHTQVYVSRGLGTVYIPLRVNCPGEIVLIELV